MKIGLCLVGGGAKGSYEAGVIRALHDRGIKFDSVSGTSIGAINGYFIYTGNVEKLTEMWINIQNIQQEGVKIVNNTVDNDIIIKELSKLTNNTNRNIDFFVNFVEIKNRSLQEKVVNIKELEKEESLSCIKYSSLLPFNPQGKMDIKNQFIYDLQQGLYDGYNLDGGLVNNELINPLIEKKMDKIIFVTMRNDYILPNEIKEIYNEENIIVVRPKTAFMPNDTLRFEQEFCKNLYYEGYDIGKNLDLNI